MPPEIDGYVFCPLLENDNTAQQLRIFTGDRVYGWDPDTGLAQELFRLTNYGIDISAVQQVVQPDPVMEAILAEEASAYYAGVRSAQETAILMDSRVQLYLDEQG